MRTLLILILFFSFPAAYAETADVSIVNTIREAMTLASTSIMPQALIWLGALMGIQFVLTNLHLLKSDGDIPAVVGKLMGSMLWFGFCAYVLNNGPDFIDSVGNGILSKFAPNLPSPGSIIAATLGICTSILIGIAATGTSIAGIGNTSIAMVLVYVLFTVFAIGMFMAIKLIMLQLELGLIVMLSPLSFSFLGLNALKDQGIAPFKSLISLTYRIILLGIIYASFGKVIDVASVQLDSFSWINPAQWASKMNIIFSMLCAFPVVAFLVFKSDSIAASLASGSTNMGTADVASAAAAGAATGAAIASGGAAAAGATTKGGQSMGDFMRSLTGGSGGSVSNASVSGSGGQAPVGTAPVRPAEAPALSVAENNAMRMAAGLELTGGTASTGTSSGASAPAQASPVSEPSAPPAVAVPPSGSGASAGIGGASGAMDQKMDKLIDSLSKPAQKPLFGDRMSTLNDHVAKEQAATHVSINTHHGD